jgi:four helix bundle protein
MRIRRFEEIESWQMARELTRSIYSVCRRDPFDRDFALRDQIVRACGSIMHNIAEGFDAGTNPDFCRFLGYSKRSCSEVQSQLYVALDLHYISHDEFTALYEQARLVRAKIWAFMKYLDQGRDRPSRERETLNREP